MGKVVGGVIIAVIGAILAFAVRDNIDAVDLTLVGYILIAGGALIAIVAGIFAARGNRVHSSVRSTGPEGDRVLTRDDRIE